MHRISVLKLLCVFLTLLSAAFARAQGTPVPILDVSSREFSLFNGTLVGTVIPDAVSREFSLFNGTLVGTVIPDAVSREFSLFNGTLVGTVIPDAVSREFSLFNGTLVGTVIPDAVSREFSLFNGTLVGTVIPDAVSREFSVVNAATPTGDNQAPETRIVSGPAEGALVTSLPIAFVWTGTDDTTPTDLLQYSFRLDNGPWSEWSVGTTTPYNQLTDGFHTFEVRARDLTGNIDPTPDSRRFRVETDQLTIWDVQAAPAATECVVTWKTNHEATSQVEYGLTAAYGFRTVVDASLVLDHRVVLTGLAPRTTYHFRVLSLDVRGNAAASGDLVFTTSDDQDTTAPDTTITGGPAEGETLCANSATFNFTGTDNVTATAALRYRWRLDGEAWQGPSANTSVTRNNLSDGAHRFEVAAIDLAGNVDPTPALRNFSVDATPPSISNLRVVGITSTGATVLWDTNKPTTSLVEYREQGAGAWKATSLDANPVTAHSVGLVGLRPGTAYEVRARSQDKCEREALSEIVVFTTRADTNPPETAITGGPVDNSLICDPVVTFDFSGADDVTATADLQFRYRLDSQPWSEPSRSTTATFNALADGAHTFDVAAIDEAGNIDPTPALRRFIVDTVPLLLANVRVGAVQAARAEIRWDTNKPATSQVEYRIAGEEIWEKTGEDVRYMLAHAVVLSGLRPDTLYEFRVRSKDNCAREAASEILAFHTLVDNTPPDTAVTVGPSDGGAVQPGPVVFEWTGLDDATPTSRLRYQYQLDEGPWTPAAPETVTTVTFQIPTEGEHVFQVQAVDESGNVDPTPDTVHFRTDATAPTVVDLSISDITFFSAVVNWATSEPTTGLVQYTIGDGEFKSSFSDPNLSSSHSLRIGPLASNTPYRVRVLARDQAGNLVVSPEASFTSAKLRDLSVGSADLAFSSAAPAAGDSITMTAQVHNKGDLPLTGTLVFYDFTRQAGSREIGRRAVLLPAYAAAPALVTSPPFTVTEGLHSPYVRLISVSPADDIPGNNAAQVDLLVDAPACRFSIGVSNPKTWPGNDSLFTAIVKNTGSQAQALGGLQITGPPWVTLASELPTEPLEPGQEAQLTFRMTPPLTQPGGTLSNPLLQPLVLSVSCGGTRFTGRFAGEVFSSPICSLDVTVVDSVTGQPVPGATIALDDTDRQYFTNADGKPMNARGEPILVDTTPGSRNVYAVAQGFLAAAVNTDCTQPVVLRLVRGKSLEVTQVRVRELSPAEVAERGVDLQDPNNFTVFDFVLEMKVASLPVRNVILPKRPRAGQIIRGTFPGIIYGGSGGLGGTLFDLDLVVTIQYEISYPTGDATQRTETWIVIPGDIRVLKQFWEASVFVKNNTDFSIADTQASLELPPGLALPELFNAAQQRTQALGTIAPRSEKGAQWIVRGDRAGKYRLTGRATGRILLGGSSVPLESALQSDEIEVVQPRLRVTFDTPKTVRAGQVFLIGINITNQSPIDLNGVSVNIKGDRLTNARLAAGAPASIAIGTIRVGETRSVTFRFESLVTGEVVEVRSYVSGATVEPPVEVVASANQPPRVVNDVATTAVGSPITLNVLANDSDPDGDPLTVASATEAAHGTLVINADSTITYTPAAGFIGDDQFNYTASDGNGGSAIGIVTVTVGASGARDITGSVRIDRGGYHYRRATGRYVQEVILTNISGGSLAGPMALVLDNLSASAALYNKTGVTGATTPINRPYLDTPAGNLAPGASVTLTLEFTNPSNGLIVYDARILDGSGAR